ncbi:C-1-tetrahydrofolate synthase, cytoplasmic-like [Corticium candelabrum]|uniref:C-1-tetrahydrofolate synthase, cytoplasmic-like n=1 Tax=Corticium candelabrum TaxID=121492 RepID=UPI002E253D2B|nr:C-1-tetrahydrofolate synthase, cytoplasmic-like [Corticium candelabrum]
MQRVRYVSSLPIRSFSTFGRLKSSRAQIIDGKKVASSVRQILAEGVEREKSRNSAFLPFLAIVQVGNREDSNVYVRNKIRAAEQIGMKAEHIRLPNTASQSDVVNQIEDLNQNPAIHGMLLQLPLDTTSPIDSGLCTQAIHPAKDVDGLHTDNAGKLAHGELQRCIIPCTPRGCLELIKSTGVEVTGKRAVVIGRSKIVGSPMSSLLLWNHATVTTCHSKTKDLAGVCSEADILIAAVGKAQLVKAGWVKPGAVVIDCGINAVDGRLIGDVDFESVKEVASWITPVPGGVGPMTVAMLLQNTFESAKRFQASNSG